MIQRNIASIAGFRRRDGENGGMMSGLMAQTTDVLWTSAEAATATGGRAVGRWTVGGVCVDPGAVAPGDLYVALQRDADTPRSVADAYAAGAAAVLVERRQLEGPALVAANTSEALKGLAAAARDRSPARRVAIAGPQAGRVCALLSNMMRVAGSTHGETASGAPASLSLARMPRACERAVFELETEASGALKDVSSLVAPHVAIIAPLGDGADEAAAAQTAEIFDGLELWGAAVIPGDHPAAQLMGERAGAGGAGWLVRYGVDPQAEARLVSLEPTRDGARGEADIFGHRIVFAAPSAERTWGLAATAALAGAYLTDAPLDVAAETLSAPAL